LKISSASCFASGDDHNNIADRGYNLSNEVLMRFAPMCQSLALLTFAAVPVCFAQRPSQQVTPCWAARIFTPPALFTMPVAKPPQVKDGIVTPAPACQQTPPRPIIVKRLLIRPTPQLKPGKLQLLPNPFAPAAPATPKP
jgi:hypothetical protein